MGGNPALRLATPAHQELDEDKVFEDLPGSVSALADGCTTGFGGDALVVIREQSQHGGSVCWQGRQCHPAKQL